jgi:UDP-N-acetylmuramoylalanine--D-glutamate ligase
MERKDIAQTMDKINKVAIFGMGKSGQAAVALAKKLRQDFYAVNRGKPEDWYHAENLDGLLEICSCYSEEDFAQHFHKMDEIIISPGIPVTHPALVRAVEKGVPILSEIEYAWRLCKDIPVIAITGSNGKTTTTTMITEALKKAGKKVFCGGNIGNPFCHLALSGEKPDYAVIEVSSFQLETIHDFHPLIGLILNIVPNHSERYDSVHDYAQAKFRILKNMEASDLLIVGSENPYLDEIKNHPVEKFSFTKGKLPLGFHFDFSRAKVKGEHNEANFFAAWKVLQRLNIPNLQSLFQEFINDFPGVAHRLEFVLSKEGISVYNDAKSTNLTATETAIKAFKDDPSPFHLIIGGKLRNDTDTMLSGLLPYKDEIDTIFTIGDVTDRVYEELKDHFQVFKAKEMKTVFELVKSRCLKGNLVLSPGFPSFDQFKNYVDRGEKFKQWARESF